MKIKTFEDLEQMLENWVNFHGEGEVYYDFIGLLTLIKASLKNLNKHSIPADFEGLDDFFDDEEVEMLKKLIDIS